MKNPLLLALLSLVCACNRPPEKAVQKTDPLFSTTQPSRLYFKNMRSFYYQQSTKPGTKIDVYVLKKNLQSTKRPKLVPIIADNWMEDEAYILLERSPHPYLNTDTLTVRWESEKTGESGVYQMAQPSVLAQYELANFMYIHLNSGHKLSFFTPDKEWEPLFTDPMEAQNFLTTIKDYNTLTEKDLKEKKK